MFQKFFRPEKHRALSLFLMLIAGVFLLSSQRSLFEIEYYSMDKFYQQAYADGSFDREQWNQLEDRWEILNLSLVLCSCLLMAPWVITGIIGGIRMTIKKLQGTSWWIFTILFGLIPLAIWLIFLAFTGILGVWAWNWSIPMLPSKRRCAQCRGWNDYDATRCRHCSQPLS